MRRWIVLTTCLLSACSGNPAAPTAPEKTLSANITVPLNAAFDLPGCNLALAASVGVTKKTCAAFTGQMKNVGDGCAADIAGTTTSYAGTSQPIGVAAWTYPGTVQPGAMFVYTGGALTYSTASNASYATVATWTNVSCN